MTASVDEVLAVMGEGQWTTGAVAARLGWLPEAGRRVMAQAHVAGRVRRCEDGKWQAHDVRGAILSYMQASPTTLFTPAHLAAELVDLNLSHDEVASHLSALSGGGCAGGVCVRGAGAGLHVHDVGAWGGAAMTGDTIRLSTAQRFLMQDLQDGHAIQRRGRGADQVFFTQNGGCYIRSPRPVADALVRKGLAHWVKTEPTSTFQFVLKEGKK